MERECALAREYVPFLDRFKSGYQWSLMQVEYSWDLVWKKTEDLAPVYEEISRQAILTVKAADVAKLLRALPFSHYTTKLDLRSCDAELPASELLSGVVADVKCFCAAIGDA